uniref:Uncharacterized protein n=1 Tax=Lepeophtheirus salmonis TaxID=72036 RepID=A0A0K2SYD4_LEPSM
MRPNKMLSTSALTELIPDEAAKHLDNEIPSIQPFLNSACLVELCRYTQCIKEFKTLDTEERASREGPSK